MNERSPSSHPFWQLLLARMREFGREPEVLFWVFGFPILLAVGLGIAFRNKPAERVAVGVLAGPGDAVLEQALASRSGFDVERVPAGEESARLRLGKIAVLVVPGEPPEYRFDPTRPDSLLARERVDDALQRAAGRADVFAPRETVESEPGARYIDFLIPGLLGMNIMSGGMWGVGFAIVDMRSRRLLKRLIATPMRRSHFMGALMTSRVLLVFAEMLLLLLFGWLVFDMRLAGSLAAVALLSTLGAFVFAGLGLLVGCRAKKIESVSGLMNLVMLPMFVFSGVFFSSERFPAAIQPFVQALPLTALNDALRAVILEGQGLSTQLARIGILVAWGIASFVLAGRFFRWA